MVATWKLWLSLFSVCSLLCTAVTQLQLEPLNSAVLQGSDARFNAIVQGSWDIMTWNVGGHLVLTVRSPSEIISSENYNATFCSSGQGACVEFTIFNVSRTQAGPVVCSVQGSYIPQIAQLSVQDSGTVSITGGNVTVMKDQQVEFQCVTTGWFPIPSVSWNQNGQAVNSSLYNTTSMAEGDFFNSTSVLKIRAVSNTKVECTVTLPSLKTPQSSSVFMVIVPNPPDWTVLISVVVSFGGFALLVLLILGIIFCYKRRKEKKPNYQDEMRKVRAESLNNAPEHQKGQVNLSYVPDNQIKVTPNVLQENGQNNLKTPGVNNTAGESGFMKHRHLTIV
ncbi:immunoglobulin superfamily member 5 isoform X1 [Kryptolebias marmoratus]|uniref:Immunoglobulin superfamily member 5-like n=1 Tax=Kryptolebias marmoratus TaxID=37003 RepID=A0A3Q3ATH4_KRYMA|nr:immunoglobulin superfamily member 5 isoform X1 [Kryptolebias marmoratus]